MAKTDAELLEWATHSEVAAKRLDDFIDYLIRHSRAVYEDEVNQSGRGAAYPLDAIEWNDGRELPTVIRKQMQARFRVALLRRYTFARDKGESHVEALKALIRHVMRNMLDFGAHPSDPLDAAVRVMRREWAADLLDDLGLSHYKFSPDTAMAEHALIGHARVHLKEDA